MKANKFVKKFGVVQSKYHLSFMLSDCQPLVLCDCILSTKEVGNLKRLIKSHELVEFYNGLDKAKKKLSTEQGEPYYNFSQQLVDSLKQAIADVESCM